MVLLMTTIWWTGDWSDKRGGSSRNGNFAPQSVLSGCRGRLTDLPYDTVPWLLCRDKVRQPIPN